VYARAEHDDPAAVTAAVRARHAFPTTGPLVDVSVEGIAMGGDARAVDGHARLALRVRADSSVDCDRATVLVNGDPVAVVPIADPSGAERLQEELELCFLGTCERHARAHGGD